MFVTYYRCVATGPVHGGPRRCWIPVSTAQLSNSTTAYTSMDAQSSSADDEREPMLPPGGGRPADDDIPLYRLDGAKQQPAAAVALIPVIVPVVSVVGLQLDAAAVAPAQQLRRPGGSLRRHNSNASNREVKFDETVL